MLELILESLAWLLFEWVLPFFAEVAIELGFESVRHATRRGRAANPWLARLGLFLLGLVIGFVSAMVAPHRVWRPLLHPSGISVLIAPIVNGAAMFLFGAWRRGRGGDPSLLATFWGGALLAFGLALARWWCVVGSA
jgi:hypothetical protein